MSRDDEDDGGGERGKQGRRKRDEEGGGGTTGAGSFAAFDWEMGQGDMVELGWLYLYTVLRGVLRAFNVA